MELLLASLITALVTAAGVTMAVAVSYAADSTRRDSTASLQGHSAMQRLAQSIRGATIEELDSRALRSM